MRSFTLRVCHHLKTSSPARKQRTCVTLSLCPEAVTLSGRRGSTREPHWRSQSAWTRVYKGGRRVQKREESASVSVCECNCVSACVWNNIRMSAEKLEKKKTILLRGKHIGWDSFLYCFYIVLTLRYCHNIISSSSHTTLLPWVWSN